MKKIIVLNWLEKFKQFLLYAILLTIPSNLFFKLNLEKAYLHGFLVDYLIDKIYLLDCFLLLFLFTCLISFLIKRKKKKIKIKSNKIYISILVLLFIFTLLNLHSLLLIYRLSTAVLFFLIIKKDKQLKKTLPKAIILGLAVQSFFAYFQFKRQDNLAPYYYFGETNLHNFANITKGSFVNEEKILPYGTTAHPNILAGIVLIFSIFAIQLGPLKRDQRIILLFNCLIIAVLTQSISALLSLLLFFLFKVINEDKKSLKWQKNIVPLIGILIFLFTPILLNKINLENLSIQRRTILNQAANKMFLNKAIFGVGYNQFTRHLEEFSDQKEIIRFIQPVHHLGLLILSEGGILLAIIISLLLWKNRKEINWQKLAIIAPIAALDHYLITQAGGIFALTIFLYFVSEEIGQ